MNIDDSEPNLNFKFNDDINDMSNKNNKDIVLLDYPLYINSKKNYYEEIINNAIGDKEEIININQEHNHINRDFSGYNIKLIYLDTNNNIDNKDNSNKNDISNGYSSKEEGVYKEITLKNISLSTINKNINKNSNIVNISKLKTSHSNDEQSYDKSAYYPYFKYNLNSSYTTFPNSQCSLKHDDLNNQINRRELTYALKEVHRLINPNKPLLQEETKIVINLKISKKDKHAGHEFKEEEKDKLQVALRNFLKQYSTILGYACLNYSTVTEIDYNKIFNTKIISTLDDSVVNIDFFNSDSHYYSYNFIDKEFISWPEFHYTAGLVLMTIFNSKNNYNNETSNTNSTQYNEYNDTKVLKIKNYLITNSPNISNNKLSGMYFALGILNQLTSETQLEIYQKLKDSNEIITISTLLAIGISNKGTGDQNFINIFTIYFPYENKPLGLLNKISIISSALIGYGFLLLGKIELFKSELLSNMLFNEVVISKDEVSEGVFLFKLSVAISFGLSLFDINDDFNRNDNDKDKDNTDNVRCSSNCQDHYCSDDSYERREREIGNLRRKIFSCCCGLSSDLNIQNCSNIGIKDDNISTFCKITKADKDKYKRTTEINSYILTYNKKRDADTSKIYLQDEEQNSKKHKSLYNNIDSLNDTLLNSGANTYNRIILPPEKYPNEVILIPYIVAYTLCRIDHNDISKSSLLPFPRTYNKLENYSLKELYHLTLSNCLNDSDQINPSINYIFSQLPHFMRTVTLNQSLICKRAKIKKSIYYSNNSNEDNSQDFYYYKKNINTKLIKAVELYTYSAAIHALAIKYSGTNDSQCVDIIISFINYLRNKVIYDCSISNYANQISFYKKRKFTSDCNFNSSNYSKLDNYKKKRNSNSNEDSIKMCLILKQKNDLFLYNNSNSYGNGVDDLEIQYIPSILSENVLYELLAINCMSLGLIASGSGSIKAFDAIRKVRVKFKKNFEDPKYGLYESIYFSMSLIFCGNCCYKTTSNTKYKKAMLYLSTLPFYPINTFDNSEYLQVLKYLIYLTIEQKV